jgi:hypothetical protein
MAKLEELGR